MHVRTDRVNFLRALITSRIALPRQIFVVAVFFFYVFLREGKEAASLYARTKWGFVTKVSVLISRRPFVLASIESKFFSYSTRDRRYWIGLFQECYFVTRKTYTERDQLNSLAYIHIIIYIYSHTWVANKNTTNIKKISEKY